MAANSKEANGRSPTDAAFPSIWETVPARPRQGIESHMEEEAAQLMGRGMAEGSAGNLLFC